MQEIPFTEDEIQRYSRQLVLPGWTLERQKQLRECSLTVPAQFPWLALYMAGAGIGQIVVLGELSDFFLERLQLLNPSCKIDFAQSSPAQHRATLSQPSGDIAYDLKSDSNSALGRQRVSLQTATAMLSLC